MHQVNRTNCKNCGGTLHYDTSNRLAICEYCGTEYHLDNLGIIEEYKVEIEVMGRRMKFYINEITINPTCIEATRLYDGTMNIVRGHEQVELTLISYGE